MEFSAKQIAGILNGQIEGDVEAEDHNYQK